MYIRIQYKIHRNVYLTLGVTPVKNSVSDTLLTGKLQETWQEAFSWSWINIICIPQGLPKNCQAILKVNIEEKQSVTMQLQRVWRSIDECMLNASVRSVEYWIRFEWNKRRCTYVHWRIYSSRDLDTLLYKVEVSKHWKNTGLYTLATKDWDMWELLLGANWQVRIDRITIAWETVTWVN